MLAEIGVLGSTGGTGHYAKVFLVPHREIVLRECLMHHGLQRAVVLEPVGEGIADDGNVVAGFEIELSLRGKRGGEEEEGGEFHGIREQPHTPPAPVS